MRRVTDRVSIKNMILVKFFPKKFNFKIVFWVQAAFAYFLLSCAPQGSGILGNPTKLQDLVDQQTKQAPFAYDLAVDTISYNSCVSENVKTSGVIHGLKIGASEGFADPLTGAVSAGLKLRTDFLQYIGKNFKPEYPNTVIKPSQLQKILSQSDYNKDAYIQFAVRRRTDFVAVPDLISPGSNNTKAYAQVPRDLTVITKNLYSGLLGYNLTKSVQFTATGAVLAEGPRVYNLSDNPEPIVLEATFQLNGTSDESYVKPTPVAGTTENYGYAEIYADTVRADFTSKKNMLAITFGGDQNIPDVAPTSPSEVVNHINLLKRPKMANSQSTDNTKAFGRGYQLTFESPNIALPSWLKTRLTKVTEISLDNGAPVSSTAWSCENFLIMHPTHWDNNRIYSSNWTQKAATVEPSCSPIIGTDLTGTNGAYRQTQIKRLRRHYSAENWNIGLYVPEQARSAYALPTRSIMPICLVPKSSDCYLPTLGILDDTNRRTTEDVGIQYDTTQECYLTKDGGGDTKRELGRCAQFASVCVRSGF
jgi:hypothetical protein